MSPVSLVFKDNKKSTSILLSKLIKHQIKGLTLDSPTFFGNQHRLGNQEMDAV